jgi:hypothetical protein
MWASRAAEAGGRAAGRGRRPMRRARAALRLHRNAVVAVVLGAGIVLMVLHWR